MGLRCIDSIENQSVHRSDIGAEHRRGIGATSARHQSDIWSGSLVRICGGKHRTEVSKRADLISVLI